ncbi:D-alanyl-lipoteichoic acid biosynthesis protein DltD [Staphylococcus pettenkoferi]|nr:D-alanyl-lipoteichoic acid biosynthesis protein DltD [Staphylococcus pettenkoferi]
MKKYPAMIALVLSAILFIGFLLTPAQWYQQKWTTSKLCKQSVSLSDNVLKGTEIQSAMLKNDDFYPVYGSSELNKDEPYQSAILLKHKDQHMFYVGKGGSTSLIQAITLGAQYSNLKGKKMTVLISPQWFSKKGVNDNNYTGRSSKEQVNAIFENKDIPVDLKKRYAKRLLDFKANKDNDFLKDYVNGDTSGHFMSPWKMNNWQKIEAIKSHKPISLSPLSQRVDKAPEKERDFDQLEPQAVKFGDKHSKSNEFGIKDPYWKQLQKHRHFISRNHEFKMNSPEFKDLELLTDTLNVSGADVQYVILPVNGKWYDHINIKPEKRYKVYHKIQHVIEQHDKHGTIYDMRSEDYEPHTMSDAVHIGWRGWVVLSEHIQEHIDGKDRAQKATDNQ